MSSWSSFKNDKVIVDKWRSFLQERQYSQKEIDDLSNVLVPALQNYAAAPRKQREKMLNQIDQYIEMLKNKGVPEEAVAAAIEDAEEEVEDQQKDVYIFRGKRGKGIQSQLAKAGIDSKTLNTILKALATDLKNAGFNVLEEKKSRRIIDAPETIKALSNIPKGPDRDKIIRVIVKLLRNNKIKLNPESSKALGASSAQQAQIASTAGTDTPESGGLTDYQRNVLVDELINAENKENFKKVYKELLGSRFGIGKEDIDKIIEWYKEPNERVKELVLTYLSTFGAGDDKREPIKKKFIELFAGKDVSSGSPEAPAEPTATSSQSSFPGPPSKQSDPGAAPPRPDDQQNGEKPVQQPGAADTDAPDSADTDATDAPVGDTSAPVQEPEQREREQRKFMYSEEKFTDENFKAAYESFKNNAKEEEKSEDTFKQYLDKFANFLGRFMGDELLSSQTARLVNEASVNNPGKQIYGDKNTSLINRNYVVKAKSVNKKGGLKATFDKLNSQDKKAVYYAYRALYGSGKFDNFAMAIYENPNYQEPEAKTQQESVSYDRMKILAGIK